MAKSTVEEMNDLKEQELKKNKSVPVEERNIEKDDPASVVDDIETFTETPSTKLRKHRGPIGIDKEPGTV